MLEDSQKYNTVGDRDHLLEVLTELASGGRKMGELSMEDLAMLEEATLEFATAPATKQLEEGRKQLVRAVKATVRKVVKEVEAPPEKDEVPDGDMPPFWWL